MTIASKTEYKVFLVNFVKQLLLIKPNQEKTNFTKMRHLENLLIQTITKDFSKKYLNSQKLSQHDEMHFFYKDQIAVELEIYLNADELFKFTVIKILSAAPNTKDENNSLDWYPLKSKIVTSADLNEPFFNILMQI